MDVITGDVFQFFVMDNTEDEINRDFEGREDLEDGEITSDIEMSEVNGNEPTLDEDVGNGDTDQEKMVAVFLFISCVTSYFVAMFL